jgi:hypothetical protein
MKTKEPAIGYVTPNSVSALRHQLITQIERTEDTNLLEQCMSLVTEHNMPCFFTEEELDAEIQKSLHSGNATENEVNTVFSRWKL